MAKLLKHFGLVYGNNKKSDTFDFRAKTLPAPRADRESVRVATDTAKSSGRRSAGARSHTVDCGDCSGQNAVPTSHSSRRASHETFLTIPVRGLRSRTDRDWSLKGTRNRESLHPVARDSETRRDPDTKDLRRSMTADEISSNKASSVTPAVGEYSDPFDLKKGTAEKETSDATAAVILPLSEDDYSVPYEMKEQQQVINNMEELKSSEEQLEVGETGHSVTELAVVDAATSTDPVAAPPKYDDPYEENPIIARNLRIGTEQKCSEVTTSNIATAEPVPDVSAVECEKSTSTVEKQKNETKSEIGCSATPMRSFELSAEYGGFFVVPVVNEKDKDVRNCRDQQPVPLASTVPGAHGEGSTSGVGLYDEPWDLSTVKRSIEEHLRESSHKDAGRTAAENSRPTTVDVYAQPHRGEKRQNRIAGSNTTDPRVTNGPCYGVLCERITDGGFLPPPPLARRKAGIRSNQPGTWTMDSRPLDDYDVPWDQKKKAVGKTTVDAAATVQPSRMQNTSSFVDRDIRLPLEKQIWYHGSISRRDAEQLLRMCREGSYLVRTSESNRLDYSLSVRSVAGFMHMKIVANHEGRFILGQFSQPFHSIAQMIHYYTMNKLPIKGAEHISLSVPVPRQLL